MELYIYILCLAVGFVFTMASAVFGHLLGGHDASVEGGHVEAGGHGAAGADASGDNMPGVSPYSPMVISSFVASFGGLGIIFHEIPATQKALISAPLSLIGAFVIAYVLVWLLRKMFLATQGSSESKLANVIGLVGEIITPIPENGVGEIAYVDRGTRYSAPAREETGAPVSNGRAVKITRIAGSQFYVSAV